MDTDLLSAVSDAVSRLTVLKDRAAGVDSSLRELSRRIEGQCGDDESLRIVGAAFGCLFEGLIGQLDALVVTMCQWPYRLEPADVMEPEPVPVAKGEFRRFAAENGYSKERAGRVWNVLDCTAEREQPEEYRGLPAIRYIGFAGTSPHGKLDDRILDLRSVYERLVAGELRHEVWGWVRGRASKADITFLIHMVNEYMKLEPPLAFTEPDLAKNALLRSERSHDDQMDHHSVMIVRPSCSAKSAKSLTLRVARGRS